MKDLESKNASMPKNKLLTDCIVLTIFSILPILIGFYIYLIGRTKFLLYDRWISYAPTFKYYLLAYNLKTNLAFPKGFVVDSLPTALWAFSFGFVLNYYAFKNYHLLIGLAFILAFEFGQLLGMLSGTFDLIDLLSSAFAYILPYVFLRRRNV